MAGNVQEELTRILQKMQASGVERVWLSPDNVSALKAAVPGQTLYRPAMPQPRTPMPQPVMPSSQAVSQPGVQPPVAPPHFVQQVPVAPQPVMPPVQQPVAASPVPVPPGQPAPVAATPVVKPELPADFGAKVAAADWDTLAGMVQECRYCPLRGTCRHPLFMAGQRKARVVFVGDFPFAEEDATGVSFAGLAGEMLKKMGIAMKLNWEQGEPGVAVVNLLKCRPSAPPPQEAWDICGHYLRRQLELLSPDFYVLMGAQPLKILGGLSGFSSYKGKWLNVGEKPAMLIQSPASIMRFANNQAMFLDERRQAWIALQQVMAKM